jgi:hypothetical protein
VFEVLIKAGGDIEAPGGSIGGGTPLDNAVGYGRWQVARRLIECGAQTKLWHVAALGLMSRVEAYLTAGQPPHRTGSPRLSIKQGDLPGLGPLLPSAAPGHGGSIRSCRADALWPA